MDPSAPKPLWTFEELLDAALQLPREERLRIAERLFESTEDESWPVDLNPAWRDEIATELENLVRALAALSVADRRDVVAAAERAAARTQARL